MNRIVLLALLSACSGGSSEPAGPEAVPEAAASLASTTCTMLEKSETPCTAAGQQVDIGGHTVQIEAWIDKKAELATQSVLDLRYELTVDGKPKPALTTTVVGSGRTRADAFDAAAQKWAAVYGSAITDALLDTGHLVVLQSLADEQDPPVAFHRDGWRIYPGWVRLEGRPAKRKPLDIDAILDLAMPVVGALPADAGTLHTLDVRVEARPGYPAEHHCAVDGEPSKELCERIATYEWPETGQGYVMEQFLVLTPGADPKKEEQGTPPTE